MNLDKPCYRQYITVIFREMNMLDIVHLRLYPAWPFIQLPLKEVYYDTCYIFTYDDKGSGQETSFTTKM